MRAALSAVILHGDAGGGGGRGDGVAKEEETGEGGGLHLVGCYGGCRMEERYRVHIGVYPTRLLRVQMEQKRTIRVMRARIPPPPPPGNREYLGMRKSVATNCRNERNDEESLSLSLSLSLSRSLSLSLCTRARQIPRLGRLRDGNPLFILRARAAPRLPLSLFAKIIVGVYGARSRVLPRHSSSLPPLTPWRRFARRCIFERLRCVPLLFALNYAGFTTASHARV